MKIIRHIPNTITSMNLLCGVMGVIFTLKGQLDVAFYLMLAGAACDFCDGLAARALKAYSELGKQLDSLADMVSFGTLPAIMMYQLMLMAGVQGFWCYIPLLIAVFSALRLAKFNIDERQSENFIGLATPACAIICGSFACYLVNEPTSVMQSWAAAPWFIPVVSLILCGLLVSEIPMFSMKFKKSSAGTAAHKQRIAFLGIVLATAVAVPVIGLDWTMIPLLIFVVYVIMNIGIALLSCKK
jgi:CDP-diacylglycerol--serine O-phosphatidyltransferase